MRSGSAARSVKLWRPNLCDAQKACANGEKYVKRKKEIDISDEYVQPYLFI